MDVTRVPASDAIGERRVPGGGALLPQTRAGRVACGLGIAFVAWFVLNQAIMVGVQSMDGIPRVPLIVFGLAGLATGLAAGVVGAWAVARRGERGALVYLAMLPAAFVLVFLVGELLVPH